MPWWEIPKNNRLLLEHGGEYKSIRANPLPTAISGLSDGITSSGNKTCLQEVAEGVFSFHKLLETSSDESVASFFAQGTHAHSSLLVHLKAWIKWVGWCSTLVLVDLHLHQSPELQQSTWKETKEVKLFRLSPSAASVPENSRKCSSCGWGNCAPVTGWNEGVFCRWKSGEVKGDGVKFQIVSGKKNSTYSIFYGR